MKPGTITVDPRAGSIEVLPYLTDIRVPTLTSELPFGDFTFDGLGPDPTRPWVIGVERKTIGDICQCIQDGRFSGHQLPGLIEFYDHRYLLIEGRYQEDMEGLLTVYKHGQWMPLIKGRQRFLYSMLSNFLSTIRLHTPVQVIHTEDIIHTASELKALSKYYAKPWTSHSSHLQPHDDTPTSVFGARPSLVRKVANQLKGVGWDRAALLASYFPSVWHLANASEKAIMDAGTGGHPKGQGVAGTRNAWGAKLASDIYSQLRNTKTQ